MKLLVTITTLFALATFIVNVVLLIMVGMYGNKLKKLREGDNENQKETIETFKKHKQYVQWFVITLLVMVVFIEIPKLVSGVHGSDSVLFMYHINFVVGAVILIVLTVFFNGNRAPSFHFALALGMFHAYGCMALTGLPLMYESVMKYYS